MKLNDFLVNGLRDRPLNGSSPAMEKESLTGKTTTENQKRTGFQKYFLPLVSVRIPYNPNCNTGC